jgi:cell wall-associated NlpC family hydrolase
MPVRADIVRAARSFVGMPFVHQGRGQTARVNGRPVGGIDCAGLIIVVGHMTGCIPLDVDVPVYSRLPDGETIRRMCGEHATRIGLRDTQAGDILVFKWPGSRFPQHLAILSDLPDGRRGMIHSYFNVMKVVETGFADPWPGRVVGSYAYLGLEDVQ